MANPDELLFPEEYAEEAADPHASAPVFAGGPPLSPEPDTPAARPVAPDDDLFPEEAADYERERLVEKSETYRTRMAARVGNVAEKALEPTGDEGVAPVTFDPEAREGLRVLSETGLREGGDMNLPEWGEMTPEERAPSGVVRWVSDLVGDNPESLIGKLAESQVVRTGAGALVPGLPAAGYLVTEALQQFRQMAAPPGKTVRTPTVVSTTLDVLETPQRVLLSPVVADMRDEDWYESFAKAMAPPSWMRGTEPRDAFYVWQGAVAPALGLDPDSWWTTAGGFAFAVATDPASYTGYGAVRKAGVVVATKQAAKIAEKHMRRVGVRGASLMKQRGALARRLTEDIMGEIAKGEHQTLEAAAPRVRDYLLKMGGEAAANDFDMLGSAWGRIGLRVGLPFTEGKELISAQRFHQVGKKIVGYVPEGASNHLRALAGLFNVRHEEGLVGAEWMKDYYLRQQSVADAPEHMRRRVTAQIDKIFDKVKGDISPDEQRRVMEMASDEMAEFGLKMDNPDDLEAYGRVWVTAAKNMPHRVATERFADGTLRLDSMDPEKLSETGTLVRDTYANALFRGKTPQEAIQEFGEALAWQVEKGKIDADVAAELAENAERTLVRDLGKVQTVWDAMPKRLEALNDFHDELMEGARLEFNAAVKAEATSAATRARERATDSVLDTLEDAVVKHKKEWAEVETAYAAKLSRWEKRAGKKASRAEAHKDRLNLYEERLDLLSQKRESFVQLQAATVVNIDAQGRIASGLASGVEWDDAMKMATGAKRSKMHFSIDSGDVAHPVERMESLASNKSGIERRLRHVRDQIDRVRPADPRYRVLRTRDKIAESLRLERERKLPFVSTEGGVPAGIGTNKVARRFVAKQQRTIERLEKKLAAAQRRLDAEVRPSNKKLHALEQQERTILGELSETNSLYYRQKDLLRVLKEHDVLPVAVKGGITVNAPRSKKGYEALRAVTHSGWKYNRLKSEARLLRAAESIEKDILSTEAMWERQAGLFDKMVGVVRPGGHLSDEAIAAGRPALSRRPDFREDVTDTLIAKARRVGDRIFQNTYDRVMGNAIKEREGYFFHGLQNIKAINRKGLRSRVSTSAAPQRARQFLDIIENYEHGQDPVSDMKVITGMRMYAHARMMNKMEATKNVFADRRWAVPRHESRGLRAQDGWGDLTHPLTGEQYRVRTEVIEHFERAMSFMEPGKAENFIKHYWDPITSIWKGWATFARPAFYNLRNMLDDGFRMWMGGFSANPVEMGKSIKATFYAGLMGRLDIGEPAKRYARQARRESKTEFGKWFRKNKDGIADTFDAKLKEIADDVDTYGITNKRGETISPRQAHNAATQRGIVEKGYTTAELHPGDADLMESARKWDHEGMSWRKVTPYLKKANPLGSEGFWMQGTGATARFMENTRRMMLFIDRWRAGETFDEAAKQVKKWLFDYKELTGFERQVARRIVPFYTFMRKNIPAQMEAVMRHPGRYLAVGKAKRAVEAKAELEQGPIGVVRDYMDDLWAWRLPMTTKNGSPLFLNTGLSFVDFNVFGSFKNTGQEELFDRVHPGFDLWEVYKMERDPRTNLSLKGKWMEPDAILGAMVKGHNIAMPKWRQIPVMEMTQDESGHSYDVIPAYIVKSYEKMIPHFVAFGKVLGRDRVDPFMEESDPYRSLRERWAVTLMPNNPVKAEMERLRVLEKESFGGVKAIREGESLRPKK